MGKSVKNSMKTKILVSDDSTKLQNQFNQFITDKKVIKEIFCTVVYDNKIWYINKINYKMEVF